MALIDLTNYREHPELEGWLIFRYPEREQARAMAEQLRSMGIDAEEEENTDGAPYLVGVRKRHLSDAERANWIVLGRFRKPFIADPWFRWGVLIVTVAMLALAVYGLMRG